MMNGPAPFLILILEDQSLVRAGMRQLVQICEPRSQIHEASNHDEATAKLTSHTYDIAFLDIDLKSEKSDIDGLKYIRTMDVETRAIMLSARSEREVILECVDAGASGYILKDIESDGVFRHALDTVFLDHVTRTDAILSIIELQRPIMLPVSNGATPIFVEPPPVASSNLPYPSLPNTPHPPVHIISTATCSTISSPIHPSHRYRPNSREIAVAAAPISTTENNSPVTRTHGCPCAAPATASTLSKLIDKSATTICHIA
jgi:CheY-like chemotaxis protein